MFSRISQIHRKTQIRALIYTEVCCVVDFGGRHLHSEWPVGGVRRISLLLTALLLSSISTSAAVDDAVDQHCSALCDSTIIPLIAPTPRAPGLDGFRDADFRFEIQGFCTGAFVCVYLCVYMYMFCVCV